MKRFILTVCLVAAAVFVPACNAVTVSSDGKQLLKNGNAWEPHGFVSIALVQTSLVRPYDPPPPVYQTAYNAFSEQELTRMNALGADTIRFQVSQPGLDPSDTTGNYDPAFLADVETKLQEAINDGFIVILCLQNENQGGTYPAVQPTMPDAETASVWGILAADSVFKNNPKVMFEIFNEPQGSPTTANWNTWKSTHNTSISAIRAAGANNVIIADGLQYAETLDGAPDLTDTISPAQIAYATHPFFHTAAEQAMTAWETNFGNFAATHAVVNTAWGAEYNCDSNTADQSVALLQYMHSINVGMMAYAMDNANNYDSLGNVNDGKMFQTIVPWVPSTLVGASCGSSDTGLVWGPGKIIRSWYVNGVPPSSPE